MASSAVKFQEMLAWLMTEVMYGRAHFMITRGLSRADQAVLTAAPKFFDLTRDAHANAAQMAAARIFDQSSGVSIYRLMSSGSRSDSDGNGFALFMRCCIQPFGRSFQAFDATTVSSPGK